MAKETDHSVDQPESTMDGTLTWERAKAKYQSFKAQAKKWVARFKHLGPLKYIFEPCKSSDAIYFPTGPAAEYGKVGCSIYVGCYGGCGYCYRNDPILAGAIGGSEVRLKKAFKSEAHAFEVYFKELFGGPGGRIREEIREHGIFFTFTSDPGLPETFPLFAALIGETVKLGIPVQFLTKFTGWIDTEIWDDLLSIPEAKKYLSIGFTLTGRDDLEPGAAPNEERVAALRYFHNEGFKTFVSIEPILDFECSFTIMIKSSAFVDLFRVGLESHRKYDKHEAEMFVYDLEVVPWFKNVYLKDSLLQLLGRERDSFPEKFVDVDFRP
jgi:DNA repair photolyase